jgi:capsular polysaccharide biosynthesis protein
MLDIEKISENISSGSVDDDFIMEEFYSDTQYIELKTNRLSIRYSMFTVKSNTNSFLDFRSDNKKCIISLTPNYYHFIVENVGYILSMIELNPTIEFIFHRSFYEKDQPDYITYFLNKLTHKNIKHSIINFYDPVEISINNFYVGEGYRKLSYPKTIYKFFKEDMLNVDVEPFRKVYLSRKITESERSKDLQRMTNHDEIEKLFSELGFEIIQSEDFNSFMDQINYFYETKILISITGAGLGNMIFMQPKQTVIELFTPLTFEKNNHQLHFFHHLNATAKNHTYVSIANIDKNSKSIKNKIVLDDALLSVMGSKQQ